MENDSVVINGINGATGGYLLPPIAAQDLGRIALGEKWNKDHLDELEWRKRQVEDEAHFALKSGLDAQNLSQAGWGVIFPAQWDQKTQMSVHEAFSELLNHRRSQAGPLYKEYIGGEGYRPNESKNDFLERHGAGPGPVDPRIVPYYLLIIGDPQTIPFEFQYELDVAYLVGRVYFDSLDEYAQYARNIVMAETSDKVKLARQAVFFGVANPNDRATQLSAELLIKPLVNQIAADQPTWEIKHTLPENATKENLLRLLGGDQTPALLFTASHGLGFPYDDPQQLPYQGALLCQDWPGPSEKHRGVTRDDFLAAEDIASDANLLGLFAFHFACFGAGTPYWDDFAKQAYGTRTAIAPRAFLSALPQRLLGHPRGALAVVGHIDRAWSYSFKWGEAGSQTITYQSALSRLMTGDSIGTAMDDLNIRYAEISTMLNNQIYKAEYEKVDLLKLASLWTANNDARDYALVGDPAVRMSVAPADAAAQERPVVVEVPHREAALPPIPSADSAPAISSPAPQTPIAQANLETLSAYDASQAEAFMLGADTLKQVRENLANTLQTLAARLATFVEDVTSLEVATFTSESMESTKYDLATKTFTGGAQQRALTHISLDGDTKICVPIDSGEIDESLWAIHTQMVQQALANRTAMIKAAADVLTGLLPK